MKIRSSFKDFYDFSAWQADETVQYIREPDSVNFSSFIKTSNYHTLLENIEKYEGINVSIVESRALIDNPGNLKKWMHIRHLVHIIGVFPDIYFIPTLVVMNYSKSIQSMELDVEYSYVKYDPLLWSLKICSNDFRNKIKSITKIDIGTSDFYEFKDIYKNYDRKLIQDNELTLQHFCPDMVLDVPGLFRELFSPIFYIDTAAFGHMYIVRNCNLKEIAPGVNWCGWISPELIYQKIEEFLIERGTKDVPTPDNKTKILNAGFDLKTSFRKM